jgi:uncharacterized protein
MFSIQKLAVFALIAAAIWLGFRLVGKLDKRRREDERAARPARRGGLFRRSGPPADAGTAAEVDMVACKVCGDYVPARGAKSCGRPDCPFGAAA